MKFTINSKVLKDALERLTPAYNPRAVVPIVELVRVEILDGSIELTMTDLQTTIKHKVECSTKDKGVFLLPFKEAKSISGAVNAPAMIEWSEKCGVVVKFDNDVFKLGKTDKPEVFPVSPKVKKDLGISVGKDFFNAIRTASKSVSKDAVLSYQTYHVCVEISKEAITITGTDKNTLFTQSISGEFRVKDTVELLLPSSAISALGGFEEAEIFYDKKNLLIVGKDTEVCLLLGEGKYPAWRSIIPRHAPNLSLDINDLEFAINKSFAINRPNVFSITLQPTENELHIKTDDKDTGMECNSVVPCKSSVSFEAIAFNRSQLLSTLKQLSETGGVDVEISMPSPERAALIKMNGFDNVTALVMPIQI